jgi:pantoate--beta-alanine ligase
LDALSTEVQRPSHELRNERLTDQQRRRLFNFKTLNLAKEKFKSNSATAVTQWVEESFKTNTSFKLEYFQIADETTLKPCLRKKLQKIPCFYSGYRQ